MFRLLIILFLIINNSHAKTVILGFDGMDPVLSQQWMDSGDLPNFKKLAELGSFQPLATTNPAQSPVAWSSFATGLNPGEHGIFDFIHRDANTFEPVYSISGIKQPETYDLFGWEIPISDASIYNKRLGKPFWLTAEQWGNNSSILRVPVTYPPDNVTSMLSGMGVPDLLGTQGTYSFYATKYIDKGKNGGNIERIKVKNDRVETKLLGPPNPFGGELLSVPLTLKKLNSNSLEFNLNGEINQIKTGDWSNWIPVNFSYGGVFSLNGMVRVYLQESFPRIKLYISPININPQNPALPISTPPEFANQLSNDIGLFHTLGMPEETWSFNDGLIDSKTYLEMVETILAEREKMFFRQLQDDSIELLVEVFVQTDRVSHMFWRGHDNNHPNHDGTNALEQNAIKWIYQQADRILGKTLKQLKPDDKLLVLSDHGFSPYYRHVNLNRWLQQNGYLTLKTNNKTENFSLKDVDWSQTSAYAMGLNGIYLNLKNREANGIVAENNASKLSQEIINKLQILADEENPVISHIYQRDEVYTGEQSKNSPDLIIGYKRGYRASWQTVLGEAPKELFTTNTDNWSGDHCIDPKLVPGVLFTNFKHNQTAIGISDIGNMTLSELDKKPIKQVGNTGLLDIPRKVIQLIIKPIHKYLLNIIAILLTGILLFVCLWLIKKLGNYLPSKFALNSIIKSLLWIITIVIFIDVSKNYFSSNYIGEKDDVIIKAYAINDIELPPLTWHDPQNNITNIDTKDKNIWQHSSNEKELSLQEKDGYEVLSLSSKHFNFTKLQKNWWHKVLSNQAGYISPFSQVKKIEVKSSRNKDYWWLWLIVGFILGIVIPKSRYRNAK